MPRGGRGVRADQGSGRPARNWTTVAEGYFEAKANGIVTHVPAMWSALGKTAEERAREIKKLIEEIWGDTVKHGMKKGDLPNAARRAIALRPALRDGRRWAETLPVGARVGHDEAEKKR